MTLLLTAGPALFLVVFACGVAFLIARGVPAERIPERTAAFASHILLGVLGGLALLLVLRHPDAIRVAWSAAAKGPLVLDATMGLLAGTLIGIAYVGWLARWLERAQRAFGDYVPPGEILSTVSGRVVPFFLANVILAPVVEETLYRGIALPTLAADHGVIAAIVISSFAFGLLHWPGGLWYMLLTGPGLGGVLALLMLWRDSVVAPFAAHLALNVIEFGWGVALAPVVA